PFPCSPALAASTAAFKARRLVWKAISSTIFMISAICRLLSAIAFMVSKVSLKKVSPFSTAFKVVKEKELAWLALLVISWIEALISSMVAEISSSVAASSCVRWERSVLAMEISYAVFCLEKKRRQGALPWALGHGRD